MDLDALGKLLYESYHASAGTNRKMPRWDAMGEWSQNRWKEAAGAVAVKALTTAANKTMLLELDLLQQIRRLNFYSETQGQADAAPHTPPESKRSAEPVLDGAIEAGGFEAGTERDRRGRSRRGGRRDEGATGAAFDGLRTAR